ncbi:cytochrome c [bacterium]|nr:cytochrome c [bacterium]
MRTVSSRHISLREGMGILLLLTLVCLVSSPAYGRTRISPDETTEIAVEIGRKVISAQCFEEEAGTVRERKRGFVFLSFRKSFRKQTKLFRRTGSSRAKKKRNRFRRLMRAGNAACAALQDDSGQDNGGGENNTPTPTPTPEPAPTGYFTDNGDVTDLGKSVFEIPQSIAANAMAGEIVYNRNCTGCHEKRSRPTMPLLRLVISQAPMYYDEQVLPDQDIADLTAYLNVFRTP